jgi:hypothetical protein
LLKAGLSREGSGFHYTNEELFLNLENIWTNLGRQPIYDEIRKPFSRFSAPAYERRFGSWLKALEAFVNYINFDNIEEDLSVNKSDPMNHYPKKPKRRTSRHISNRLRFQSL